MKLVTAILALALTATANAQPVPAKPAWMSTFAWAVGMCETQLRYKHRAGSYEGFAGWYAGTWDLDKPNGYPDHAYQATPRQQYRVFLIGRKKGRYWGCIHNGGYRYWMDRVPRTVGG